MLQTLREHERYAKLKNYKFWLNRVNFGYVLFKKGIKADLHKIKMVTKCPRSINVANIRSFPRLARCHSRFL